MNEWMTRREGGGEEKEEAMGKQVRGQKGEGTKTQELRLREW